MASCLSDVLNDSCFPKTLGSEPQHSYLPELSVAGVLMACGILAAFSFGIWLVKWLLMTWYYKYQLQYLTRIYFILCLSLIVLNSRRNRGIEFIDEYESYIRYLIYLSLACCGVMLKVRCHWKRPLSIVKSNGEMKLALQKKLGRQYRRMMTEHFEILDIKSLPPVFPNGWIPIWESKRILPGEIVRIYALGKKICLFRGSVSGTAFALDAYCPHLGADLTAGGRVRGDCIECPFHGWYACGADGSCYRRIKNLISESFIAPLKRFLARRDALAACSEKKSSESRVNAGNFLQITGGGELSGGELENIPGIKAKKWHVRDINGSIHIWHHAESSDMDPTWEIPVVEPVNNGEWTFRGRTEHVVNCHIQEIPENGADLNHLEQLHTPSVLMGCNWMNTGSFLNILNHHWEPKWRKDEEHPHIARISLKQSTTFCGFKLPYGELELEIEQIGPATVHLHIKTAFGRAILFQNIIPEAPLRMRVIHLLYAEPSVPTFAAEVLLRCEAIMFERNFFFRENTDAYKTWLKKNKDFEDCPIREYHQWYFRNFFSQNSYTERDLQDMTMDY